MLYVAATLVGITAVWAVVVYNRLIGLARYAEEAWSGIAVQLKRRHDLVPNLVQAVSAYAAHEKNLLENVSRLRSELANTSPEVLTPYLEQAEGQLGAFLGRLLVVAEAYPQLNASDSFMALHKTLVELEDQIQMARRYYNGTVRNYNILVDSFPSLLIARLFKLPLKPFFQLASIEESNVPEVSL